MKEGYLPFLSCSPNSNRILQSEQWSGSRARKRPLPAGWWPRWAALGLPCLLQEQEEGRVSDVCTLYTQILVGPNCLTSSVMTPALCNRAFFASLSCVFNDSVLSIVSYPTICWYMWLLCNQDTVISWLTLLTFLGAGYGNSQQGNSQGLEFWIACWDSLWSTQTVN